MNIRHSTDEYGRGEEEIQLRRTNEDRGSKNLS